MQDATLQGTCTIANAAKDQAGSRGRLPTKERARLMKPPVTARNGPGPQHPIMPVSKVKPQDPPAVGRWMLMARRVSTAGACFGQKADDLTLQRDRDFGGSFWCGESWGLGFSFTRLGLTFPRLVFG